MNRETFLNIVSLRVSKNAKPHNDDYIHSTRFGIDNYDYDYSHAIVKYLEACGCVIKRTNWNLFGGFYVDYLGPTKYVPPEEFLETYKPDKHYDTRTRFFHKSIFVCVVLIIILLAVLYYKTHHLGN